jgi:hypothetical protein
LCPPSEEEEEEIFPNRMIMIISSMMIVITGAASLHLERSASAAFRRASELHGIVGLPDGLFSDQKSQFG